MYTTTVILWLVGLVITWCVYLGCGVGVFYFWRKGEIVPFVGCICVALLAAIPLFVVSM